MSATLKLKTNDLRRALDVVKPAIQRPVTIPVLAAVKVESIDGKLSMLATNLEQSIRIRTNDAYDGSALAIIGERLITWVKLQDADDAKMTESANGRVTLTCGRGKAVVPTLPAKDYPAVTIPPTPKSVTLTQAQLLRALKSVSFAISEEGSRYTLAGALFDVRAGEIRAVATDGHRLSLYRSSLDVAQVGDVLFPFALCRLLPGVLADSDEAVTIGWDDTSIVVTLTRADLGTIEVCSRRMSGQFPNYEAVVPKDDGKGFTLQASDLLRAVRRTATFADSESHQCRFTLQKDGVLVQSADKQAGECDDFVNVTTGVESPLLVGLASHYIAEGLAQMNAAVRVCIKDPQSAAVFRAAPDDATTLTYVVMPMRV